MKLVFIILISLLSVNSNAGEGITNLEQLVEITLKNNPEIRASQARFEASKKEISQQGTLPNPTIGLKYRNVGFDEITLGDEQMTNLEFSFRQEIPFPGKLSLMEEIADASSEIQSWNTEVVTRNVLSQLKKSYYEWFLVNKSIEITEKNRELLKDLTKIAESKYEVGKGIQQDVTKAQVELSQFIEKLEILRSREQIIESRLRSITNLGHDEMLGEPVDELEMTKFTMNTEKLVEKAKENSPVLNSQNETIEKEVRMLDLAKKNLYPDIILSTAYANRGFGDDNLDGIWEIGLGFKVPLYFRSREIPAIEEASLDLTEARHQFDDTANKLKYKINEYHLNAETAENLTDLYKNGIIPQAKLSLDSSISAYQVGKIDFLTLLDDMMTVFTFELEYYRKLVEYQTALANIEEIAGINIIGSERSWTPALEEDKNEQE